MGASGSLSLVFMGEKKQISGAGMSADWFFRGSLAKLGDIFDRLTGRRWIASSSLATSELIERMKKLLDSEAKEVPGKGLVVPHQIKLKMQWDKFSTDSEQSLKALENELLIAAVDHINDSLYYTYAALKVEVKPDYFTEGVKLIVGFDEFSEKEPEAELNVTIAGIKFGGPENDDTEEEPPQVPAFIAHYSYKGYPREILLEFPVGRRISVGRTSNNDLILDDESVSKIHASLVADSEGHLAVADTGSTNGTFINGERISYGKAMQLTDGDKVRFGTKEVNFERVRSIASSAPMIENVTESRQETVEIDGFEFSSRTEKSDTEQSLGPGAADNETGEPDLVERHAPGPSTENSDPVNSSLNKQ